MCSTRSNLPLRSSAGSIISGRFVAATTMTPSMPSTPSMLLSSWLTTRFATSEPEPSLFRRDAAMLSNSSRNTIEGLDCLAFLKTSRIAFSDSPTHFEISSGPLMVMKLALASLAIALAIRVLPVPGAPKSTIPLGGLIPKCSNISGLVRGHSMLSFSRSLTSSSPPTSSHETSGTSR